MVYVFIYSPIPDVGSFSKRLSSRINNQSIVRPSESGKRLLNLSCKFLGFPIFTFYSLARGNSNWRLLLPFSIFSIISKV